MRFSLLIASSASLELCSASLFSRTSSTSSSTDSSLVFPSISTHDNDTAGVGWRPEGRYGHNAFVVDGKVYWSGGQVGDNGTVITANTLRLDLSQSYSPPGSTSNATNSTSEPATALSSLNLSPEQSFAHAWSSSFIYPSSATFSNGSTKSNASLYIIGGITPKCLTDSPLYHLSLSNSNLSLSSWKPIAVNNHNDREAPPRRRQTSAVLVPTNPSSNQTEVWVFGGVGDPLTCSIITTAYLGIDLYTISSSNSSTSTPNITSTTMAWLPPKNLPSDVLPSEWWAPVSDYSASLLLDNKSIALIGGQTTKGTAVGLNSVLVFDTEKRDWKSLNVTSSIPNARVPSARFGHVAVGLSGGQILVHGGMDEDGEIGGESWILSPSTAPITSGSKPSSSFNSTKPGTDATWHWSLASLSSTSLPAPIRAWHTATLTPCGTIIFAFGVDSFGSPSSDLYFLSQNLTSGDWTWSQQYVAEPARKSTLSPGKAHTSERPWNMRPAPAPAPAGAAALVASSSIAIKATPIPTLLLASSSFIPRITSTVVSSSSSTTSSSVLESATPSLTPAALAKELASTQESYQTQHKITSALGTLIALLVCSLVAIYFARRYFQRRKLRNEKRELLNAGVGRGRDGGGLREGDDRLTAPFVSTLLYTKKVPKRTLSLGSTLSTSDKSSGLRGGRDDRNHQANHARRISFDQSTTSSAKSGASEFEEKRESLTGRSQPGSIDMGKNGIAGMGMVEEDLMDGLGISAHPSPDLPPLTSHEVDDLGRLQTLKFNSETMRSGHSVNSLPYLDPVYQYISSPGGANEESFEEFLSRQPVASAGQPGKEGKSRVGRGLTIRNGNAV